jgi:hypothetical protein
MIAEDSDSNQTLALIASNLSTIDDLEENTPFLSDSVEKLSQQEWVLGAPSFYRNSIDKLLEDLEPYQKEARDKLSTSRAMLEYLQKDYSHYFRGDVGENFVRDTINSEMAGLAEKLGNLENIHQSWEDLRTLCEDPDSANFEEY